MYGAPIEEDLPPLKEAVRDMTENSPVIAGAELNFDKENK